MSQFSDKLKLLIEENGLTIYQLAKRADLDRTTIQRSISGERLPSTTFVEKLCDFIRVSPTERKELFEFYTISKIGEKTYADRKYIKELIERIAALHIKDHGAFMAQKAITVGGHINEDVKTFSGQYIVNNLIQDILEDEVLNEDDPKISLTIPFDYTILFDFLHQLYLTSKGKTSIRHIVRLSKNPHSLQNSNINLEILSNILPFAFSLGNGYKPSYYYGITDIAKDITLVMPYYLYTSKRLVTLSADFKTAVLYNNVDMRKVYSSEFEKSLSQTSPFVQQLSCCGDMLSTYFEAYQNSGQITNVIEPQPCLAKYYTHKMVDEKLRQNVEQRDMILHALYKYFDESKAFDPPIKSFFSLEGMEYLVNTGAMADLPPRFALPFTVSERKFLLRSLRNDIQNDTYLARITDSSKFLISSIATIQLYENNGIVFFAADDNGIISSFIDEKSICDAFFDFFYSLPDSDLVCSKEETLRIIDGFITQLEIQ